MNTIDILCYDPEPAEVADLGYRYIRYVLTGDSSGTFLSTRLQVLTGFSCDGGPPGEIWEDFETVKAANLRMKEQEPDDHLRLP